MAALAVVYAICAATVDDGRDIALADIWQLTSHRSMRMVQSIFFSTDATSQQLCCAKRSVFS
jgi:hypothetical protein